MRITGLLLFAMLVLSAAAVLLEFGVRWIRVWPANALQRTGVFAYPGKQMARAQPGVADAVVD